MRRSIPIVRVPRLARRYSPRLVFALFGGASAALSIGIIATAAAVAHRPLLVPSLGPTAFLIFERPRLAAAAPRNIVVGHFIAIVIGEAALFITQTHGTPTITRLSPSRAVAATAAVALVMIVLVLTDIPHPPAAATALVVSLSVVSGPRQLIALGIAVALLALQGIAIDRLAGLKYPNWAPSEPTHKRDAPGGPR